MSAIAEAIDAGTLPGRVWMYADYHCNLACTYCLTESAPGVAKRLLDPDEMIRIAREAAELGYRDIGITGGEPFLLRHLPKTLAAVSEYLPTLVLTNGTLFNETRLAELAPLAQLPLALQISLDSPDPDVNDEMRGPDNFAKVIDAIPRLRDLGITVRIATTGEPDRLDEDDHVPSWSRLTPTAVSDTSSTSRSKRWRCPSSIGRTMWSSSGTPSSRWSAQSRVAMGASPAQEFLDERVPRVAPSFVALGLYRWEVATRETVVVGIVAAGGLGYAINQQLAAFDYHALAGSLIALALLTLVAELVTARLRRAWS